MWRVTRPHCSVATLLREAICITAAHHMQAGQIKGIGAFDNLLSSGFKDGGGGEELKHIPKVISYC